MARRYHRRRVRGGSVLKKKKVQQMLNTPMGKLLHDVANKIKERKK